VATLSPLVRDPDGEWMRYRTEALARAKEIGLTIDIPMQRPTRAGKIHARPVVAPDGRTDICTIDLVRGGRDYCSFDGEMLAVARASGLQIWQPPGADALRTSLVREAGAAYGPVRHRRRQTK